MDIPICTDKKLIEGSEYYFDKNESLDQIFVTPDGQYFLRYQDSIHHGLVSQFQAQKISRDMLKGGSKSTEKKVEDKTTHKGGKATKKR